MRRTVVCTSLSGCLGSAPSSSAPPSAPTEHHRGTRDPEHLVCGSGSRGPVDVRLHHQRPQVQSPLLPRLHRFRRGEFSVPLQSGILGRKKNNLINFFFFFKKKCCSLLTHSHDFTLTLLATFAFFFCQ